MNSGFLGVLFYERMGFPNTLYFNMLLNEFLMQLWTSFPERFFVYWHSLEYIFRRAIKMQKSDHLLVLTFRS